MENQESVVEFRAARYGGPLSRLVEIFVKGNFSAMLIALALIAGAAAVLVTPREEEPQIVVPMADVFISAPGLPASEVERLISTRLEKLLYQIDGVEYVYSMSTPGRAVVTVRFYVGENRTAALVKLHNKLAMHQDQIPPGVASWVVKPVEIDDVPILCVTLASATLDGAALRRLAEEMEVRLQSVPDTGRTYVSGGRPMEVKVELDLEALAGRNLALAQVARAIAAADALRPAGLVATGDRVAVLEAGRLLSSAEEVRRLVVGVHRGGPVFLEEVARVVEGPAELETYTRFGLGPGAERKAPVPPGLAGARTGDLEAVTISVAKKRGANAVWVSRATHERLASLAGSLIPEGVEFWTTRDHGETANDKVNELMEGLAIAVVIVVALVAMILGWHAGLVVAAAVPITFALTLFINYLLGYTINRVTLFALTLSLGLVVDDPIVDVENIFRHLKMAVQKPIDAVITAVNEMRPPTIMATMTVIASFAPMFFITGMMGPYMAPMALNVPLAMLMSMVVAFTVNPWLAYHVMKRAIKEKGRAEDRDIRLTATYRVYRGVIGPLVENRAYALVMIAVLAVLFIGASSLALVRLVPLKTLPFDNKNELQLVVDMPEGTSLERTEALSAELMALLRTVPEVTDFTAYVGHSSPMDFNGMVRRSYLREGTHLADLRVNLVPKKERARQSHGLALALRPRIEAIQERHPGALVKIVEAPAGPPVLATITVEVVGGPFTGHEELVAGARLLAKRLDAEPGVVEIDVLVEEPQERLLFVPDRERAALSGVAVEVIAETVAAAFGGLDAAWIHRPGEVNAIPVRLRLPLASRSSQADLARVRVPTEAGGTVPLLELGRIERSTVERTLYHKNMRPVVYVTAEMAGRAPAEAILDIQADAGFAASLPPGVELDWAGEGEWKITLDVFRDLGIAFGVACLAIFMLLVIQTRSYVMPLILMISIPLTVIGIMPGFWLLNQLAPSVGPYKDSVFFTATAMIGMIGLSGIAVRNAILLIDFIQLALEQGRPLEEAVLQSGAMRFRPILLTAGTAVLAAIPITFDPIFSGLAWALIFGLVVSSAFTLVVVPVVYFMVSGGYRRDTALSTPKKRSHA